MSDALQTLSARLLDWLPAAEKIDWRNRRAASWRIGRFGSVLRTHGDLDPVTLDDLAAMDRQKAQLARNTEAFLKGYPANNALLWGARGTGKSSLVHALLSRYADHGLRLIEVDKTALIELPEISERVAQEPYRFILFCDDLSFDAGDASYKALKSALEGSVFRGGGNVLIYATSNRRHLLPEYGSDNAQTALRDGELHESEAVEEKISLSDRFGLWLSFYPLRQDDYLMVVAHWLRRLLPPQSGLESQALNDGGLAEPVRLAALSWARARGVRSGRTAQYFARTWVGEALLKLDDRA